MTIFDIIRYPIVKDCFPESELKHIPKDIYHYWYNTYYVTSMSYTTCMNKLTEIILKYDTDECEITREYIDKYRTK